jgi:hypothetical protein
MKLLLVVTLLFVTCGSANAHTPSSGLWYNPSESGRGFNIEIQNNVMAVASYVYDQHGNPIWYTSAGIYDEATQTFTGTFDSDVGGQCLGCSYVRPVLTSGAGGPMQIVFTSYETGTVFFNGGSTPIQHFNFGYAGKDGYLQGEWAFSANTGGVVHGEWIVFDGTYMGTDGRVYQAGHGDSYPLMTALGMYFPSSNSFVVAIDHGDGYTSVYVMGGDNARMLGANWFVPTGTVTSGNGVPASANRMLTPYEVGGAGHSAKSAPAVAHTDVLPRLASSIQAYIRAHQ